MPCWISSSYWGTCLWPLSLCRESLTAIHYAAVCFQLCFLNCISLCCYWDQCAASNWLLRGAWVKSRLLPPTELPVAFTVGAFFSDSCFGVFKEWGWSQACQSLAIREYLACWSSVQFFLPLLALALQPDLLVAELFWGKFQTLFQNFRFTVWLSNMSV